MSEFKVIETQEQLNQIVGERIAKAKESALAEAREQFADYEELKEKSTNYESQVNDLLAQVESFKKQSETLTDRDSEIKTLKEQIASYETDSVKTRIALEVGIPYEMAGRLSGTTEDDIRADAQKIVGLFNTKKSAPASSPEADPVDGVTAAFMKLNPKIKL